MSVKAAKDGTTGALITSTSMIYRVRKQMIEEVFELILSPRLPRWTKLCYFTS